MRITIDIEEGIAGMQIDSGDPVPHILEWSNLTRGEQLLMVDTFYQYYNLYSKFIKE